MAANAAHRVYSAVERAFTDDTSAKQHDTDAEFLPSESWQGPRDGYHFSSGPRGQGYYADARSRAAEARHIPPLKSQKDANELLEEAEELARDLADLENIDDRGVKRVVAGLERRIRANQVLRMKHSDDPQRFLESELELDELLRKLVALAGEPELYRQLVTQGSLPLLLELLQHANVDIVAATADLLQDLTDAESVEDLDEEAATLVRALLEARALELLVARLQRFDESSEDEGTAVRAVLQTFQNMMDIDAATTDGLVAQGDLIRWLLRRLNAREFKKFDENKSAAAELLAILTQYSSECREALLRNDGINKLLEVLEPYRRVKAPLSDADEGEYVFELCNVLAAALVDAAARARFVEDQGVELMLLILRGKQSFRAGAAKVLLHSTTDSSRAVDIVVQRSGLPVLFGMFMGKNKTQGVKAGSDDARQELETITAIIANLMHYTSKRQLRERVASKFVENEFEKADRLMELFFQYQSSFQRALRDLQASGEDDDLVLDATLRDAGLFTLQQISLIFGHLWAANDLLLRKRLLMLLHQKGSTLAAVRAHLEALHSEIEDGEEPAKASLLRNKVGKLIVAMGGEVPVAVPALTKAEALPNGAGAHPTKSRPGQDAAEPPPPLPPPDLDAPHPEAQAPSIATDGDENGPASQRNSDAQREGSKGDSRARSHEHAGTTRRLESDARPGRARSPVEHRSMGRDEDVHLHVSTDRGGRAPRDKGEGAQEWHKGDSHVREGDRRHDSTRDRERDRRDQDVDRGRDAGRERDAYRHDRGRDSHRRRESDTARDGRASRSERDGGTDREGRDSHRGSAHHHRDRYHSRDRERSRADEGRDYRRR